MADEQYIETFSDVMQWKIDEWIGRCYAQSVGEVYPIPPESPHFRENGYYYGYTPQKESMPGGVLLVDETIAGFSDKIQQLSDMSYFCPDVTTNLKTYDQLSDDGKAVVDNPPKAIKTAPKPPQPAEPATPSEPAPEQPSEPAPAEPTQTPEQPTQQPSW